MIYYLTDLKYDILFKSLDSACRDYKGGNNLACRASSWFVGLIINVSLVLAAAHVCIKLSLASAGSGIGEVCSLFSNDAVIPFLFYFYCISYITKYSTQP